MKIEIDKNIKEGKYSESVSILEILPQEREQILKFGSPVISLEPRSAWYQRDIVKKIPLHDFKPVFSFSSEEEANEYIRIIKERIIDAVKQLKNRKDNFSKKEEYEL